MFKYKNLLLTILGFLILFGSDVFSSERSDSLINVLKKKHDNDAVPILNELANELKSENPDNAIVYAQKALKIADQIDDIFGKSEAYYNLGRCYYYQRDFDKSVESYEQALILKKQLSEKPAEAGLLYNIGMIYHMRGKLETALEYYQKSLDIEEKIGNKQNIARAINVIGVIYMNLKNFDIAIDYYRKSLKINEELGNKAGIADAYLNIGTTFQKNDQIDSSRYDSAVFYYEKALIYYQEINFIPKVALAINNIGVIYKNQHKLEEAISYYKRAEDLYEQINDKAGLAQTLGNIGVIYEELERYDYALEYIHRSIKIAQEMDLNDIIIDNYVALSDIYAGKNDYKVSLNYYKKFFTLKDSLFTGKVHQQIADMQTKYETDKIAKELELSNKDKEIKDKEIRQQRILIIFFIVVSIIILIFLILLIRLFTQKKKANIKLELQNEEILQQKEEIQAQAEQLRYINSELEKLSIVASETDNSVVIADSNGDFEWVNEGFTRLLGYTFDEFIEAKGRNLFINSTNPHIEEAINDSIKEGNSAVYSSQTKTKSGESIWLQTTLTPIMDSEGKLTKLVAIDSDITKVKLAEEEIMRQRDKITEQNQEITDSILYARRIQNAILPPDDLLKKALRDYFILNKPRDIVSGDFYWLTYRNGQAIIAAADCTGHGVPGAFMSMLGIASLNEIVNKNEHIAANEVLNKLRENIIHSLHQTGKEGEQKDGMDMTICIFDKNTYECQFAGANNPAYFVRPKSQTKNIAEIISFEQGDVESKIKIVETDKYELLEIKPDKMPIGIYGTEIRPFTNNIIKLEENNAIYIFSDGFADQFGGPKGKKFKYLQFKEILLETQELPMEKQKEELNSRIEAWRGDLSQIDDILVIGFST